MDSGKEKSNISPFSSRKKELMDIRQRPAASNENEQHETRIRCASPNHHQLYKRQRLDKPPTKIANQLTNPKNSKRHKMNDLSSQHELFRGDITTNTGLSESDLIFHEINKSFLQYLLLIVFTNCSSFRILVYNKWKSNIRHQREEIRGQNMRRLLLKIATCRGKLEISDKYIQIFDEGSRRGPENQELHIPDKLWSYKGMELPLKTLQSFCKGEETQLLLQTKRYIAYQYNDILTELLDKIRTTILSEFITHYIRDSPREEYPFITQCIDYLVRDVSIRLPPCLIVIAKKLLGENLEFTPLRDSEDLSMIEFHYTRELYERTSSERESIQESDYSFYDDTIET